MKRVPPSERTRVSIERLLEEGLGAEGPRSELVRLATQRIIEEILEAGVEDVLGRSYYRRREAGQEGSRNGYRPGRLKTSEGEVLYAVPQVRDVGSGLLHELRDQLKGRTESLESLAVEMYARGCSTRDIEDLLRDKDGRSLLSRTSVSEVTESLWQEYRAFASRDLSEVKPLYLFLDGIAERLRPGAKREAVLCAWAITEGGKKVLIHLAPGAKESTDCCRQFLEDLKRRGLGDPVLVATDGAAGWCRAVEECFPFSLRQRCLVHRMRNLMAKLPEEIRAEFKEAAKAAYEAPSPALAEVLRDDLVARFERDYPSATACFLEDFDACIAQLQCPPSHRRAIRTTNLLERLFREERRRTRATCNFFGERAVLKLMYGAVIRASDRWNGLQVTELELAQLQRLRKKLRDDFRQAHAPVIDEANSGSTTHRLLQQD